MAPTSCATHLLQTAKKEVYREAEAVVQGKRNAESARRFERDEAVRQTAEHPYGVYLFFAAQPIRRQRRMQYRQDILTRGALLLAARVGGIGCTLERHVEAGSLSREATIRPGHSANCVASALPIAARASVVASSHAP